MNVVAIESHPAFPTSSGVDKNSSSSYGDESDARVATSTSKCQRKQHPKISRKDQYEYEKAERYSRLLHIASAAIHKEGKVVKSFECQKIVRRIKAIKANLNDDSVADSKEESAIDETQIVGETDHSKKALRKIENLEKKLLSTKTFKLEKLIDVSLRRIGLVPSNGSQELAMGNGLKQKKKKERNRFISKSHDGGTDEPNTQFGEENISKEKNLENQNKQDEYDLLIESMLQHKRLISTIESLNTKIAEFHRWASRREAWLNGATSSMNEDGGKKRKRRDNKDNKTTSRFDSVAVDVAGHDGTSSMFIESLSGMRNVGSEIVADGLLIDRDEFDLDDGMVDLDTNGHLKRKTNRPGQRARKAKTQAMEARKEGRTWEKSINQREQKNTSAQRSIGSRSRRSQFDGAAPQMSLDTYTKDTAASGLRSNSNIKASDVATMGTTWKETGKAHPSWAAKEAQKEKLGLGIVQFAGKKTTFD